MDAKEVKSTISNLEKSAEDTTILKLLNILNDEVVPTEKLLRETKVGVVVNKYRGHDNKEISSLVKKMIRGWREAVQNEKNSKKKPAASSTASTPASSGSPASTTPNADTSGTGSVNGGHLMVDEVQNLMESTLHCMTTPLVMHRLVRCTHPWLSRETIRLNILSRLPQR